jgi:hypothetical protein
VFSDVSFGHNPHLLPLSVSISTPPPSRLEPVKPLQGAFPVPGVADTMPVVLPCASTSAPLELPGCNGSLHRPPGEPQYRGWFCNSSLHTLERVNRPACIFCNLPQERVFLEDGATLAFLDAFPVTEGHALVVPKRHVASISVVQ